jgi:hypothetical protein
MEWLWVFVLLAIRLGPIVWLVVKGRRAGGPTREDEANLSTVTGFVRGIDTAGRTPGALSGPPEPRTDVHAPHHPSEQ